mmetsp:Transcript_22673/g.68040  ORF Transcript_22673/g.68040 Transcript_22673/m.68040 type:complete len:83 (-) Transcript_22673:151-399(-)
MPRDYTKPDDKTPRLTVRDFNAYHLHERARPPHEDDDPANPEPVKQFSVLHAGRRLFHEYVLDGYLKDEGNRLLWQRGGPSS